jgi:microcystin-dependent protein
MDVIQTTNKQVDKFGVGLHGFSAGNPGAGQPATYLSNGWCDGVQQELVNVILAGGGTLSGAALDQMYQALRNLFGDGAGRIDFFARNTAPFGYLKANGALVSRTVYARLFTSIGTTFGVGDGSTTFALPDMRGEFPRGWDDGRGIDSGRAIGTSQLDAMQGHFHNVRAGNSTGNGIVAGTASEGTVLVNDIVPAGGRVTSPASDGVNGTPRTAAETRARNIALLACIKF